MDRSHNENLVQLTDPLCGEAACHTGTLHYINDNREICRHWWHQRLSLLQSPRPPVTSFGIMRLSFQWYDMAGDMYLWELFCNAFVTINWSACKFVRWIVDIFFIDDDNIELYGYKYHRVTSHHFTPCFYELKKASEHAFQGVNLENQNYHYQL